MIKLWSRRWSVSFGTHWVLERDCAIDTANEWLAVFRESEPTIEFVLSAKRPRR